MALMQIDVPGLTNMIVASVVGFVVGALGGYLVSIPVSRRRNKEAREQERALLALAELRTSGVKLRNTGTNIMEKPTRDAWYAEVNEWEAEVVEQASNLSPVEGETIRILDTFTMRQYANITNGQAIKRLSMLSERLERLHALIQRHLEG